MGVRRIRHSRAPLYRRHGLDYRCKHEANGNSMVPNVERVAAPQSTCAQNLPPSPKQH